MTHTAVHPTPPTPSLSQQLQSELYGAAHNAALYLPSSQRLRKAGLIGFSLCYYALLAYYFLSFAFFSISFVTSRMWLRDGLYARLHRQAPTRQQTEPVTAVAIDLLLLALFMLQHSVMSRLSFQSAVHSVAGKAAERGLHLLLSCLTAQFMMQQWRDMPMLLYSMAEDSLPFYAVQLLSALSFAWLIASLLTVTYYDLFRYRAALTGEEFPGVPEVLPAVYRVTRQPVFSSLLGVFWSTSNMVSTTSSLAAASVTRGELSSDHHCACVSAAELWSAAVRCEHDAVHLHWLSHAGARPAASEEGQVSPLHAARAAAHPGTALDREESGRLMTATRAAACCHTRYIMLLL